MNCITKWYTRDEVLNGQVELSVDGIGTAPMPGQIFRNPHMANVLRSLGSHGAQNGFYKAFPGKAIVEAIQRHGGVMTMEDLTNHNCSTFPTPISVEYHAYKLWEIPPNGQGIAGLIALEGLKKLEDSGLVESASLKNDQGHPQCSAELLHAQIEMMRLGFGDARAMVCDPEFVQNDKDGACKSSTKWLLDKNRVANRATKLFDKDKAVAQGVPDPSSCTVSFQVVDKNGNAMSFVNRYVLFSMDTQMCFQI
jgi:gamma-glutamyltranspeptidase/glutathione hydrolase